MRFLLFGWRLLGTFFRSHRDPGAEAFRRDLGAWAGGLDAAAEETRAASTWHPEASPRARLEELGGKDP